MAVEVSEDVALEADDVVLLCTKSQDTQAALGSIRSDPSIVCAQNGVANESVAAKRFSRVYGMLVFAPTTFLEPGKVLIHSDPVRGGLDVGKYPRGIDALAETIAGDCQRAGFGASTTDRVMRLKYGKLLGNLESAVQALAGRNGLGSDLVARLRREATDVLERAGIDYATLEEIAERFSFVNDLPVEGRTRGGGSSWQSLARGAGSIETDYLNGEIVRLGEAHGVPTPCNRALVGLALQAAREHWAPAALTSQELEARLTIPGA